MSGYKSNVTLLGDNDKKVRETAELLSASLSMRILSVEELILYLFNRTYSVEEYDSISEINKAYRSLKNYENVIILPDEVCAKKQQELLTESSYVFYLSNKKNEKSYKQAYLSSSAMTVECGNKQAKGISEKIIEYFTNLVS